MRTGGIAESRNHGNTELRNYGVTEQYFSHGIHYLYPNGSTTLQFKLAFDNYSRFLFYEEVGMIVDTITRYFGLEGISDYESLRKKFVEGKTDVTISWRLDKGQGGQVSVSRRREGTSRAA